MQVVAETIVNLPKRKGANNGKGGTFHFPEKGGR